MGDEPFSDGKLKWVAALTLLGVLVLLYREFDLKTSKNDDGGLSVGVDEGMDVAPGHSMRFAGKRSDGYSTAGRTVAGVHEGMGSLEPPVFWNAGSFQQNVDWRNQDGRAGVVTDDAKLNAWRVAKGITAPGPNMAELNYSAAEGMGGEAVYGVLQAKGAYEGMSDRFGDLALGAAGAGL